MGLVVCTTFPNAAWDVYARRCLESFVAHWPVEAALWIYLDDTALVANCRDVLAPRGEAFRVQVGKLPAHDAFMARNATRDLTPDFRYQARRFSHKIAALKATMDACVAAPAPPQHVLWLDADVITTAAVTRDWLAQFLPSGAADVSYLGRPHFHFSECGFVGYRVSPGGQAFIDALWAMYESDALFGEAQWHDSWLFDRVRERLPAPMFYNIAEGVGGVHVWLGTRLAERLEHWKGAQAKRLQRPISDAEAIAMVRAARQRLGDG